VNCLRQTRSFKASIFLFEQKVNLHYRLSSLVYDFKLEQGSQTQTGARAALE
jgi:hypothetical protein